MATLRLVLGDQLSPSITSLQGCNLSTDLVLMGEFWEEATYVKHHKKKIAFLFSAMRHFAKRLQQSGYTVNYIKFDDEGNPGSFRSAVQALLSKQPFKKIIVTHPGEYRLLADMLNWEKDWGIPVEIREHDGFLCSLKQFREWAKNKKQLRMEYFYREMRKQYNILMENPPASLNPSASLPLGGQWNYDADNRKPLLEGVKIPPPYNFRNSHDTQKDDYDEITLEVMELVEKKFSDHFGDLKPFYFAVTREQALQALQQFIDERLPHFGDHQDAMLQDEPWLYHSHISFYLNCCLLMPLECVQAAEQAYHQGRAPLNAVEGFIRQVIGWREYIRGIYWLKMPTYKNENFLEAKRNLPEFYWSGNTKMNCLHQCIKETKKHAYAHHIQRLMVIGNFALLAGIDPKQVQEWFLVVYADAYEWVELPNVLGMILFGDGGVVASKPYAAGGSYINKMSNYCKPCTFKINQKNGPKACPFNYLYWNFLARNRNKLQSNPRIAMMYKTYDRMNPAKKEAISKDSRKFLASLSSNH